jgi:hypothetical protein
MNSAAASAKPAKNAAAFGTMSSVTNAAWQAAARHYRRIVERAAAVPELAAFVQKLVDERDGPSYPVETPVVYNRDLDTLDPAAVRLILVADNPGRREQAAENRRYLVGPSGKIAERFFRERPALGIDFRANVLILNKTPIHTPRTVELRKLCALGGKTAADAVVSSQKALAGLLLEFWEILKVPVWIIGYSEMKQGGVFEAYTARLKEICAEHPAFRSSLLFFRHFSMNQFTIDLNKQAAPGETTAETLARIGADYRKRVLG